MNYPDGWEMGGRAIREALHAQRPQPLLERWAYEDLRGFVRRGEDWAELMRRASPWRTRVQLDRLDASPRRENESFRFAVLGDAEPGRFWFTRALFGVEGMFPSQLKDIHTRGVDFVMQLGDMVSRGSVPNYLRFFRELEACGGTTPYLSVVGNHDRRFPHGRSDTALYGALFGPTDWFFDRGPVRFVVLDTSARRLSEGQLLWLDRALDTERRKVVFTHVPPAALGSWTDFAGRRRALGGFKDGAVEFVKMMSRRRVDRVYFGHIHAFGVQELDGVRYVLSGGGGSPLYPLGLQGQFYHYLSVEIGPAGARETVYCADGRSFDIAGR
ncbi:MAG: metallophosphoesterase [Elusimicrobiota bacterium]